MSVAIQLYLREARMSGIDVTEEKAESLISVFAGLITMRDWIKLTVDEEVTGEKTRDDRVILPAVASNKD